MESEQQRGQPSSTTVARTGAMQEFGAEGRVSMVVLAVAALRAPALRGALHLRVAGRCTGQMRAD
jgi:hypothetical protein